MANTAICSEEKLRLAVWGGEAPDMLVAHNYAFERLFVTEGTTDELPWICTYKVALRAWPEAPRHSIQVLRCWRGLRLDPALAMHAASPCRAGRLRHGPSPGSAAQDQTAEQMIAWTAEPKHLPTLPFGKHRGLLWAEVPLDYLQWMVRQTDMDADAIWCAEQELQRRARL